jgi:penicillin-binding protein 1A
MDTEVIYYTKTRAGGKWAPRNYDGRFHGKVSIREALAFSYNVATIKLLEDIGPENVIPYARAAGINSPLGADLSLALGTYVVTPIELTQAFATIANNGIRTEPFAIRMIKDHDGRILEENSPKQERTLNPEACQLVTELMKGVVEYGTGKWAREYGFTYPAAGKTGTTDDYTDAWFTGFMPQLAATVYVGCDERKSLGRNMSGSVVALPIWADFMKKAYPFALIQKNPPTAAVEPETK